MSCVLAVSVLLILSDPRRRPGEGLTFHPHTAHYSTLCQYPPTRVRVTYLNITAHSISLAKMSYWDSHYGGTQTSTRKMCTDPSSRTRYSRLFETYVCTIAILVDFHQISFKYSFFNSTRQVQ